MNYFGLIIYTKDGENCRVLITINKMKYKNTSDQIFILVCLELITGSSLLSFQNSCWWSCPISFFINIPGHTTRLSVHVCTIVIPSYSQGKKKTCSLLRIVPINLTYLFSAIVHGTNYYDSRNYTCSLHYTLCVHASIPPSLVYYPEFHL